LLDACQAGLLDPVDLLADHGQPRQVAAGLVEGVRRDRQTLGRSKVVQLLGCPAQLRLEAADAEPDQRRFHPVDDPRPLADQVLPLAAWPLGVLLVDRRNGDHPAMPRLAPQPTHEHAQQHRGVQPVGLCPPVLARDGHARGMDDMSLDPVRPQPARQPKAVASSLVGDNDALDRASASSPPRPASAAAAAGAALRPDRAS